jgi:hypothetical protein
LRTVLFLLPPLALPPLAFDLSLTATLAVALMLLWLAAAAGVFSMLMLEGSDHVAQHAFDRRRERSVPSDDTMQEALATISRQLDALDERVASLQPAEDPHANESSLDDLTATLSHRPQEHWPDASSEDQYDLYGHTAVADTFAEPGSTEHTAEPSAQNWSESRWRR